MAEQDDVLDKSEYQPNIDLSGLEEFPPAFDNVHVEDGYEKEQVQRDRHDQLLSYLLARLKSDKNRNTRAKRYGAMDRLISTWQRRSREDSARMSKEESTGKSQAVAMNMPMIHTHVDDMVSFFAEIYSPAAGAFAIATLNQSIDAKMKEVLEQMNEDAAVSEYYTQITAGLRALIKYNVGGYEREWLEEDIDNDSEESKDGVNFVKALDMYNFMWDQAVMDPKNIRKDAEWAATAEVVNRMHLVKRALQGQYYGVNCVLDAEDPGSPTRASSATFYKYPPIQANVTDTDSDTGTSEVDWSLFGKQFSDESVEIQDGYEIVNMYCWLNPADFDLTDGEKMYTEDGYFLWRFKILNGKHIIYARPMNEKDDDPKNQGKTLIPIYAGYLNRDDLKGANRSIAELLAPFQRFTSFLMNAHIAGARSSIWGIKTYDPTMFDMQVEGDSDNTVMYLASKAPGRDVRTGLQEMKGTFDGSKTLDQVQGIMGIAQTFFPAQAMPAQIAGIDRAVTQQVTAVMQGVSRRLHMFVKTCDESIFSPMRFDMYRTLIEHEVVSAEGVTDKQARKALGSGLAQLHREIVEASIRQVMMAMMQNPKIIEAYDISSIFNFWARMQATPIDIDQFKMEQRQQPLPAPAEPGAPAPGGAPNLAAVGAPPLV